MYVVCVCVEWCMCAVCLIKSQYQICKQNGRLQGFCDIMYLCGTSDVCMYGDVVCEYEYNTRSDWYVLEKINE